MATATREHLLVRIEPPAARITLNRPEKRNALSLALMEELIAALEEVGAAPEVRAIVIEGAGPAFSAGHDLGEMVGRDAAFYEQLFDVCTVMMETIHRVPQPVIAKVHGDRDRGGLPARRRLRPRRRGRGHAVRHARSEDRALLLDADGAGLAGGRPQARPRAAAHRASRSTPRRRATGGCINRVVPADELEDAVAGRSWRRSPRSSPLTIRIGKEAFYEQIDLDERAAYELTRGVMAANAQSGDAQEGMDAFLDKRPPTWPAQQDSGSG